MKITIASNSYVVTKATITAFVIDTEHPFHISHTASGSLRDGLYWSLEIEARDEWITFRHEDLRIAKIRRWTDLVGSIVVWDTPIHPVTGEMNGSWYGGDLVSGHHEILEANLQFTERDGCKLHLKWEGICNAAPLSLEPGPDERLPFKIDCWCDFLGVSGSSRELIVPFIDINDFAEEFVDIPQYAPGRVPILKPRC